MPSLGRQFTLGVLYDRRREAILEGPKLWNHQELSKYDTVASYGTQFEIVANVDIRNTMKHFDLSASLKMSFLSGMIKVAGSASYLDDRKENNRIARVSLGYKSATFKRSLAPELFLKVTYPEVLKETPDATDVVVAIQYGAGAIFTFERVVTEKEKMRAIQGKLHVSVTKLPSFSVDGKGSVNITEKQRKEVEKFSCHFHGDFILKKHPGTYEEAIKVYKELPSLLGKNYENSVPVKIWLYPIEQLPVERSDQIVYDINESLVASVTDVITDLQDLTRQCNDVVLTTVSRRHARINDKVTEFMKYIKRYEVQFKQQLTKILPEVRRGTMPITELTKLISKKESSPFSKRKLDEWLSYYNEEVNVLSKIQSLPNYCKNDGDFSSKLLNDVRFTIGLTLQLGKMDEQFLKVLKHYLATEEYTKQNSEVPKWFRPGSEILSDLYVLSITFNEFYERTKAKHLMASTDIQFLVREKIMEDGDTRGITIELYDQAALKDKNYQLTSPPGKPKATEKTYESIHLVWQKPTKGLSALKHYNVNVYVVKEDGEPKECEGELCKVTSIITTDSTRNITGLKSQTSYYFTVSAYTDLGETSVSVMSDETVTDKCVPGTYHLTKHTCKECGPGTYSDKVGMTSCNICPAGTYNSLHRASDSKQCKKCVAGKYSSKLGSQSEKNCISCSVGTYSSHIGADHLDACQKCPKGTYGDKKGLRLCNRCSINSYNPEVGQSSCLKCPTKTHTQSAGATSSSACIGVDAVGVAQRKISDVRGKMEKDFNELKSASDIVDVKLSKGIKVFQDQEKGKLSLLEPFYLFYFRALSHRMPNCLILLFLILLFLI